MMHLPHQLHPSTTPPRISMQAISVQRKWTNKGDRTLPMSTSVIWRKVKCKYCTTTGDLKNVLRWISCIAFSYYFDTTGSWKWNNWKKSFVFVVPKTPHLQVDLHVLTQFNHTNAVLFYYNTAKVPLFGRICWDTFAAFVSLLSVIHFIKHYMYVFIIDFAQYKSHAMIYYSGTFFPQLMKLCSCSSFASWNVFILLIIGGRKYVDQMSTCIFKLVWNNENLQQTFRNTTFLLPACTPVSFDQL